MKLEELRELTRQQMPDKRWQHTLGVVAMAIDLARRYGADLEKAELAALLHDFCKSWTVDRQREMIEREGAQLDLLQFDKELWHAHAAAYVAIQELGVTEQEVLDAIRFHTSGRAGMTLLDKVVCLADYIEPGRDFPGVHNIREIAEYSLEKALLAGFDGTIRHLLDKGRKVYPLTLIARNSLLDELERAVRTSE